MASTIKLKNSNTAGNAPSSLEQGEVAINVADGNLFYGDGSSVLQNFALNNITASDNISASGHITASDMFLSGDLTLGKTDDSVLTIVSDGSNISHEIHGRENSHSFLSTPTTQNLGIGLNTNETPQAKLHVSGNISASGDIINTGNIVTSHITASGGISANILRLTSTGDASATSTGHAFQSGLTNDANVIINSNEVMARNNGSTADLHLNPDGGAVSFNNSVSTKVRIQGGHVTASGNISSSGTVFTTNIATPDIPSGNQTGTPITIKAGRGFGSGATAGALFLRTSQGMGTGLGGNITLQPGGGGSGGEAKSGSLNLNSPKININGAITASGNISSSGTVFADKLHLKTSTTPGPIIQLENDSGGSGADSFIRFGDSSENYSYALGADDSGNSFRIAYNGSAFDGAVLGTNDVLAIDTAGNITASGNISSSGNVAGLSGSFSHIVLEDNSRIVAKNSPSTTYIELQNDDGFQFRANNTEVFTVFSNGAVFNDLGVAQADFRIESDNDTHIFFVDSGNDKVAIGTDTVGSSLLTVDGDITATDITASGTISASIIKSNNIVGDTSQNTQLFVGGAITASGDISSSANVIAQHITASGNIRGTMPQIISANMGSVNLSTENFIPLSEGELEGTNGDHPRVNLIAPFSGSLRRVVMRSNAAFGTSEFTASLHTIRPGGALSSDKDTVGQCFVDTTGDNNAYAVVFDFTNSVVGSNVIDGGDRVLIGVESTRTNSQNYFFTSVFTWDYQETTGLQTTSTSTSGGSI